MKYLDETFLSVRIWILGTCLRLLFIPKIQRTPLRRASCFRMWKQAPQDLQSLFGGLFLDTPKPGVIFPLFLEKKSGPLGRCAAV